MAIKQKKPEPVVFDTARDLLIAMIIGRHFAHNKRRYYFSNKRQCFRYAHGSHTPMDFGELRFSADDVGQLCRVLVGKKLLEVDPQFIPVDTLLLVSDSEVLKNRKTPMKPAIPQYFSHWSEGKLYCFAEGTTSLTATKTIGWRYWEFAKEAK